MKKIALEKAPRCREVSGQAWAFGAKGQTVEEILPQAAAHATRVHKLAVTPELAEAVKKAMREE